ncbi:MAG TPA: cyclic nucleotide-binding domain-containing protein [Thermoplasmata archaeon]|nr:cyclic nucleotide-binding domain-containing protein [Thermoplasmata archaeon]
MPGDVDAEVVQRLGAVPLFSSLSEKSRRSVARTGAIRSYAAGARIVAKGEMEIGFYLVLDGKVEVRADGKPIASLSPGAFFGEMALFDEQPRTADVVAVVPSRCLVLARHEFWGELSEAPEVLRALMAELVRRLRGHPHGLSE